MFRAAPAFALLALITMLVVPMSSATALAIWTEADLTVSQGTEITFDNTQGNHSLTWETGSYPGNALQLAPWDVTFTADATGTFAYYCSLHGATGGVGMSGTLTVDP